jgi:hypothetical protein
MIPIRRGEPVPPYQQKAISWLQHFKNSELLQQMLSRFYFSELEIAAYRTSWSRWLRPKFHTFVQQGRGHLRKTEPY